MLLESSKRFKWPPQTFTSGYRVSIVDLRLGKFVGSKSMRYRCFAPEIKSDELLLYELQLFSDLRERTRWM